MQLLPYLRVVVLALVMMVTGSILLGVVPHHPHHHEHQHHHPLHGKRFPHPSAHASHEPVVLSEQTRVDSAYGEGPFDYVPTQPSPTQPFGCF